MRRVNGGCEQGCKSSVVVSVLLCVVGWLLVQVLSAAVLGVLRGWRGAGHSQLWRSVRGAPIVYAGRGLFCVHVIRKV